MSQWKWIFRIFSNLWCFKFSEYKKQSYFKVRILNLGIFIHVHLQAKHSCKFLSLLSTLREKCPYSKLFWSVFFPNWTEYHEILRISPYSVWMWENTDQNDSVYEHFLRSVSLIQIDMTAIKHKKFPVVYTYQLTTKQIFMCRVISFYEVRLLK